MRRLLAGAVIAAAATAGFAAPQASAVCRPFLGPICLPACPLPDPSDPLNWACPL